MQKLAWFNDIVTFWQLWNELPIKNLERYFYDKPNNMIPVYSVTRGENISTKRITALSIFQSGIKPMWEDPVNASGSELRCVLSNNLTYELYNSIWEEIVGDLVTKKIPHAEDIAGIRIFDRSRSGDLSIRLDIWLKIQDEQNEKIKAIKSYLEPNVFKRHGQQPDIQYAAHK